MVALNNDLKVALKIKTQRIEIINYENISKYLKMKKSNVNDYTEYSLKNKSTY
jgi:hypothetical protein